MSIAINPKNYSLHAFSNKISVFIVVFLSSYKCRSTTKYDDLLRKLNLNSTIEVKKRKEDFI